MGGGHEAQCQSIRRIGLHSVVHSLAEQSVGEAQRAALRVESGALDKHLGLIIVNELFSCRGQDCDAMRIEIRLNICDLDAFTYIKLYWASTTVKAYEQLWSRSLPPLVSMAQAQHKLVLGQGQLGHYFVADLYIQRWFEK